MTFSLVSCGGDGGGNSGQGGPETTPDTIEVSDPPASDAIEQEVTTPDEDTVSSIPEQDIEGSVDGDNTNDAGDSVPGEYPDDVTGDVDEGNQDETPVSDSGTGDSSGETDSSDDSGIADSGDSTTGTEPGQGGDAGDGTSDDTGQEDLLYSLDSSQGRWFEQESGELFSAEKAKAIRDQIKQLRNEIKTIRADYKNNLISEDDAREKIMDLRDKIADLRGVIGSGGRMLGGIYTSWANENLFLTINNAEPGWYKIIIVAKARQEIPENYDRFSFNIVDAATGDILSSVSVKASADLYFSGKALLKLDNPYGQKLNIVWTNDAYKKDEYDVNLNIKNIILKKTREPKVRTVTNARFKGDQYNYIDGRWFFDKSDAYTYWANQTIGYTFKNLEEGTYEIKIQATNHGNLDLPKKYDNFIVAVDSHYGSTEIAIQANNKGWKWGEGTLNLPAGDTTIYLTWLNDSWKDGEFDTNFKMKAITVKKIKPSSLTAYLLKTKPGNRLFVLVAFLAVSGMLFGIYVKNRTKTA
jgi:hypothetical protein